MDLKTILYKVDLEISNNPKIWWILAYFLCWQNRPNSIPNSMYERYIIPILYFLRIFQIIITKTKAQINYCYFYSLSYNSCCVQYDNFDIFNQITLMCMVIYCLKMYRHGFQFNNNSWKKWARIHQIFGLFEISKSTL